MQHQKQDGLALRQQSQALTPETERSAKEAETIMPLILTQRVATGEAVQ